MLSPDADDSSELIRRAQSRDKSAFQQLAEQNAERLCRWAFALCRDRHQAEEIAQETLVEAWRSLARFDGRCRFSTWLYGILRHRFLKARRQHSGANASPLLTAEAETLPHLAPSAEALFEQSEDAQRVRRAVADLPDEHRQVIELRFFADATLDEIAAVLEVPLGTVKSRLHNGLEKLRKQNLVVNLFPSAGESPARLP